MPWCHVASSLLYNAPTFRAPTAPIDFGKLHDIFYKVCFAAFRQRLPTTRPRPFGLFHIARALSAIASRHCAPRAASSCRPVYLHSASLRT